MIAKIDPGAHMTVRGMVSDDVRVSKGKLYLNMIKEFAD